MPILDLSIVATRIFLVRERSTAAIKRVHGTLAINLLAVPTNHSGSVHRLMRLRSASEIDGYGNLGCCQWTGPRLVCCGQSDEPLDVSQRLVFPGGLCPGTGGIK